MMNMGSFWLLSGVVCTLRPSHAKVQQGKVKFLTAAP
jgi:hypothetical protein